MIVGQSGLKVGSGWDPKTSKLCHGVRWSADRERLRIFGSGVLIRGIESGLPGTRAQVRRICRQVQVAAKGNVPGRVAKSYAFGQSEPRRVPS